MSVAERSDASRVTIAGSAPIIVNSLLVGRLLPGRFPESDDMLNRSLHRPLEGPIHALVRLLPQPEHAGDSVSLICWQNLG